MQDIINNYNNYISKEHFWIDIRKIDPRMKEFIDKVIASKKPSGNKTTNYILSTDSYKASQFNMFNDEDFDEHGKKERLIYMHAFNSVH